MSVVYVCPCSLFILFYRVWIVNIMAFFKQGSQHTYNIMLRQVHATTVAGKNSKYHILWGFVCSHRYPACNAHAPYCHLWPVWLYSALPHYLINSMIFKKKLVNIKCVFWFSLQLLSEKLNISYSKKNWARYDQKCTSLFM